MVDSIGPKAKVNYRVAIAHINILCALNTHGEIHLDWCSIYTYEFCLLVFTFDSICNANGRRWSSALLKNKPQ